MPRKDICLLNEFLHLGAEINALRNCVTIFNRQRQSRCLIYRSEQLGTENKSFELLLASLPKDMKKSITVSLSASGNLIRQIGLAP